MSCLTKSESNMEGAGGIGGLLARSHGYSAGNWSTHNFYHADGNGNVTYLVNSSQTRSASYRYDPYGNNYGYRWYDPNLQRWLNRDPLGDQGLIALSFRSLKVAHVPIAERMEGPNLFIFVANRPTDSYDPNGTISVPGIPFPCPVAWVALYCIPECKARHAVPAPKCTITKLGGEIYIVMDCGCWIPPWCPW